MGAWNRSGRRLHPYHWIWPPNGLVPTPLSPQQRHTSDPQIDGDRAAILSMYHRIPEGALVPRALADRVLNPECIYDKGLVLQGGIHSLRKQ